jgi:hypothetical protein
MPARNKHLPRGRAWRLTTADINDALGTRATHVRNIRFLTGNGDDTVLRLTWTAPDPMNHGRGKHPASAGLCIYVCAIDAAERTAVRAALRTRVLPDLPEVITSAQNVAETWRRSDHDRSWRFASGHIDDQDSSRSATGTHRAVRDCPR